MNKTQARELHRRWTREVHERNCFRLPSCGNDPHCPGLPSKAESDALLAVLREYPNPTEETP